MSDEASSNIWTGDFGYAYTARNVVDWRTRTEAWHAMLGAIWDTGATIGSILEVGCNRGHNLKAIAEVTRRRLDVRGIDISMAGIMDALVPTVKQGTIDREPSESADLVFTAGLLIHIPPEDLDDMLRHIVRVSRRWVLAIEYYAPEPTEITYQGQAGLLWKRDFEADYQRVADLRGVATGFWDTEHGFDRCHWWLMEKVA